MINKKALPVILLLVFNFYIKMKTQKSKNLIICLFVILFSLQSNAEPKKNSIVLDTGLVSVKPQIYEGAFLNPLEGLRSTSIEGIPITKWYLNLYPDVLKDTSILRGFANVEEEVVTLVKDYVPWISIENTEADGVEKILQYGQEKWNKFPDQNIKVIPRVFLDWPFPAQNNQKTRDTVKNEYGAIRYVERYWPSDIKQGDYTSEKFKKRVVRLIKNLAIAWDHDPRIAYIEMGFIGWWGEQHSPPINSEMQKILGDAFTENFKEKKIMVRQASEFMAYQFGEHWDSFAHIGQETNSKEIEQLGKKWETTVRGGEVAYDWGNFAVHLGNGPNETLKVPKYRKWMIDKIRNLHNNHLGCLELHSVIDPEVVAGAEEVKRALGYRFVMDEVQFSRNIDSEGKLDIKLFVRNIGSSPFYYNWPLEISLLHPKTKLVVWKEIFKNTKIADWLPGDSWDDKTSRYTIEPKKYEVAGSFRLPKNIASGNYILAISILDPAGNLPAVRFAITNYFNGGRHPIGIVGVGTNSPAYLLENVVFDDIKKDKSLHYLAEN